MPHASRTRGSNDAILFGGWGGGIRNDLFILSRTAEVQGRLCSCAALACKQAPRPSRLRLALHPLPAGRGALDCAPSGWDEARDPVRRQAELRLLHIEAGEGLGDCI